MEDESSSDHGSPSQMVRDPLKRSQKTTLQSAIKSPRKDALRNCVRHSREKSVRRDECSAAVDGCSSSSTVTSKFNAKQRFSELEPQVKPSQGNMKRSKRIEAKLNKIISLKTNPMASSLEMTRIEEDLEEDQINDDRYINQVPLHSSPAQYIS